MATTDTIAARQASLASERRFFPIMALAIAATVVVGFMLNAAQMHWRFLDLPTQVHIHAAAFSAWILLYVAQNWLIVRGSIARHRQLGVLGGCIAVVMVVLGIVTTVMAIE